MDAKNVETAKSELEYFSRAWLIFVSSPTFWPVCKGRDINTIEGEWLGKYWRIEWPRGVKTRGKNVFCTFPHTSFLVLLCAGHLVRSQSQSEVKSKPCSTCRLTLLVVRKSSLFLLKTLADSRDLHCVVDRLEFRSSYAHSRGISYCAERPSH